GATLFPYTTLFRSLRIVCGADLRDTTEQVSLDGRVRRAASRDEQHRQQRSCRRAPHPRMACSSAASIHVLAAANASGSLDFTTTSTSGPSSPKVGYEPT